MKKSKRFLFIIILLSVLILYLKAQNIFANTNEVGIYSTNNLISEIINSKNKNLDTTKTLSIRNNSSTNVSNQNTNKNKQLFLTETLIHDLEFRKSSEENTGKENKRIRTGAATNEYVNDNKDRSKNELKIIHLSYHGNFNIEITEPSNVYVEIKNNNGTKIYTKFFQNAIQINIDIQNNPKGTYIAKILYKDTIIYKKVIIQ